jgi:hypothetical protein
VDNQVQTAVMLCSPLDCWPLGYGAQSGARFVAIPSRPDLFEPGENGMSNTI